MEIILYVQPNIKGKVVEKRLLEVIHDIGLAANVQILHTTSVAGVFYTPTLIVDNKVVSSGKVLSKQEMTHFFI
ncbi:thioredoxin family protein [Evansella sp. AB-rgal1]|uniref:thioredoxin family protein n=1 Tax=Evansella sp. AB-rgal1 TaxID=3242696 RepID=UPI00359EB4FA